MAGSGKSTVREYFEKFGFENIHLGSTEECIRRYGKTSEELERKVRLELRAEYEMAAMIIIAMPKIESLLNSGKRVVIDNLYSWSEYKYLKERFADDFLMIAVHAGTKTRHKRLKVRGVRPLIEAEAKSRDYSEIEELEKGGPIAMADFHIVNEGTADELFVSVQNVFDKIKLNI